MLSMRDRVRKRIFIVLFFSPHHLVDDGDIGLDNLDHDIGDVFADVDVDRGAVVVVAVHGNGCLYGLEERFLIDTGEYESGVVEALGALGGGADTDGREGMPHGGEERGFFGECAAVGNDGGGVHLEAVIVVKAEGLVLNHARIELEAALFEAFAAARVAAVENRHVVARCDGVDGIEEREKVFFGVDVLFAVGRKENVFSFFKAEARMYVACLDVGEILMQHFGHRRAGDVGALFGKPAVGEVTARMFAVAEVDVGDYVDNASICLLGQTLVFAAVAGFHVENGNVEAFGGDGTQAGICVAENEQGIGLNGSHELVGAVDDVAHRRTEIVAHSVHIYFRVGKFQIFEEHAVEVIVVVLARVSENYIEVSAALVDCRCQTDNFGARADDDEQAQATVFFEFYIAVIGFHIDRS